MYCRFLVILTLWVVQLTNIGKILPPAAEAALNSLLNPIVQPVAIVDTVSQIIGPQANTNLATVNNWQGLLQLLIDFGIDLAQLSDLTSMSSAILDALPFVLQTLNESTKAALGYGITDMIQMCTINTVPCTIEDDFTITYSPTFGNCYTFNAGLKPKYWSRRAGAVYGLHLLLSTNQSEYSCTSTSAGFRVVIHENNVLPFPETQGYYLSPGTMSYFALNSQHVLRLEHPYGDCASSHFADFDSNYSVEFVKTDSSFSFSACQRECFQSRMVKSCSCADPRYPKLSNVNYCSVSEKKCLDHEQQCESDFINDTNCDCPPSCNETIYSATLTTSGLLNEMFKSYCNKMEFETCDVQQKNDFAEINVYYSQIAYFEVFEVSTYGIINVLYDFSNVVGLLLGVGALTFFEILYLIIAICCLCVKK